MPRKGPWLLCLLANATLLAQQHSLPVQPPDPEPATPTWKQVQPLLDRVSGMAPEYNADLGFAILDKGAKVIPDAAREAALDHIFTAAPSAHYATAFFYAGNSSNSSAGAEVRALHSVPVDALSIQSKVVELTLKTSPELAGRRFADIVVTPRRSACSDPTVQDLTAYYHALQLLYADPKVDTIAGESRSVFLMERVRDARTPEQLAPLIIALHYIDPSPADSETAVGFLVANLDQTAATDREMRVLWVPFNSGLQLISTQLRRRGVSDAPLVAAYRRFAVRSLSSEACADSTDSCSNIINNFNSFLRRELPETQQMAAPLTAADLQSTSRGDSAVDPSIAPCDGLSPQFQQMLSGPTDIVEMLTPTHPAAPAPLIDDIHTMIQYALTPSVDVTCPLCLFQSRELLLATAERKLPPGEGVQAVLIAEVHLLSQNPIEDQDPPALLDPLKRLITTSRPVSAKDQARFNELTRKGGRAMPAPSPDAGTLQAELHNSSDAIIATYLAFEDLFQLQYAPQYITSGPIA